MRTLTQRWSQSLARFRRTATFEGGEMQAFSDLLVGEVLETQLHDLAVGVRQHRDHLPQQDQQLGFVSESFGE